MIAAAVAVVCVSGALLALALALRNAEHNLGEEKALRAAADKEREFAVANAEAQRKRADFQEERANALDAAVVRAARNAPVDGAYAVLLSEVERLRASAPGRGAAGVVRDAGAPGEPAPAARGLDDGLQRPGE